jgi:hypothetical protein
MARVSKNSVRFEIGIWRRPDGSIDIASQDEDVELRTTVNNTPESKRQHGNLYGYLDRAITKLIESGREP